MMGGEEPIELPSLSAQRRGPGAAVCASGHVFSWSIDASEAPRYCAKCGDPILVACPACSAILPGDAEMLEWVPYHAHCANCGNAYPWKAGDVARAKRTLADQAELETWSDAVKTRAEELVDDIAADRAVASGLVTALAWLTRHGAESAAAPILDAVERVGSMTLKQALRASVPGRF